MVTPPPIQVANLGMTDSLILMLMALVVFGPRRLPQIGRQIGKLMYEFRKASNDFKFQMEEELRNAEDADRRKKEEAERQRTAGRVSHGRRVGGRPSHISPIVRHASSIQPSHGANNMPRMDSLRSRKLPAGAVSA